MLLGFRFYRQTWYGDGLAFIIEGDVDEIGRIGVGALPCDRIFGDDMDFHFHGRPANVGHFCREDNQVADQDRLAEDHRIHGDSNHLALGMTHTGQRAGFIHELHDPAAVHIAQQVGMLQMHQLGESDPRSADRFACF